MYEIDIFVDVKSPLSYLIVPQAKQIVKDYRCVVNFKPYNLSYVEMGLTTTHDRNNPQRLPPNEGQTRRAKMYYRVGRIYSEAMGLKIKAPKILLSAELANMALIWANKYNLGTEYLSKIYAAGWSNGWQEFDMDNFSNITEILKAAGLSDQQLHGFKKYTQKQGVEDLENFKNEANESGHVGCPHLVFDYNGKKIGLFGREHISLIRHTMSELGLERSHEVKWEVPHFWKINDKETK